MSRIDKYYKDGAYYDDNGVFYETAKDFYQTHIFDFCGCGMPDENLEYIKDGLAHIADAPSVDVGEDDYSRQYDTWCAVGMNIFGNEKSRYFFFYWCDNQGLTEHGGSVPGWLTDKGVATLSDLCKIFTEPTP